MASIKFKKHPVEYPYILAFDLAKMHTGWSLLEFSDSIPRVLDCGVVDMTKEPEDVFWLRYYQAIKRILERAMQGCSSLLVTKERMPQQNGRYSSITALQALAQCHAIFDMVVAELGADAYDFIGVAAVSEKAYYKSLTDKDKVEKEDIKEYILCNYHHRLADNVSLDITDSIAVGVTLRNYSAGRDIAAETKEVRKLLKKYKSTAKIEECLNRIDFLKDLKLKGETYEQSRAQSVQQEA